MQAVVEYFRETPIGSAKYVRPRRRRFKYDMREVDPLEAYQMVSDSEEGDEEEPAERDTSMEVDEQAVPDQADEPMEAQGHADQAGDP